jgi:hypothetical protein
VQSNAGLLDIKEIVETRVQLTPDEQSVADKIIPHLVATLKPEVRKELEVDYLKAKAEFEEKTSAETRVMVETQLKEWKKSQEPLGKDQIAELLSQEYSEFTFSLKLRDGKERSFTLKELPQEAEMRFLKLLKQEGVPAFKELVALEFNNLEGDISAKLDTILAQSDKLLEVARKLVVIILDPWGEENITADWVIKNLSAFRMKNIILTQVEVNKYRDFFSGGFPI